MVSPLTIACLYSYFTFKTKLQILVNLLGNSLQKHISPPYLAQTPSDEIRTKQLFLEFDEF